MRICIFFLFLLASFGLQAQPLHESYKELKPRNIGPAGMSGRVTAIDALYANPSVLYVGGASAGIWKTDNGGATWKPLFDEQALLNIGALKIQQSNPAVIWAGTGEGNPRNSLNLGEGVYKTLDGGKTWKRMGLENTRNIHRILIDPTDPKTVYVAAIGNPYGVHPERGVYKTTNGGDSWERILYTNDTSGCAELVMDPSNPNKLIANMWQHRREPWRFTSGGPGSGLYITVDGGKNWQKLDSSKGLPEGAIGRCGIAFAPSQPSRVYAKVEAAKNGFYKSDDGGFNWELVNSKPGEVSDRPFYYNEIYVDPKNENRIYDIHSTVTLSEDGGKSFTTLIPYSGIHPDHHAWWIHPTDEKLIIDGNDGGIGISRDRGNTWRFDEQLPFGQFYHVRVDNETPYHVMGGMQDNGSWRGPAYDWVEGGIRNYYWDNLWGGDGFDVLPDAENSDWIYAMSQGGYLGRYRISTGQQEYIRPPAPDKKTKLRFNWNSGMAQDPFDPKTIYYGSQFLHKSTDKGTTWEIISPDLTTNNPSQQPEETGGLTLDMTGAENHNTILAISPSHLNKNIIWVGTDDGNVQVTRDGGKSWTNFRGKISGMNAGSWITQVHAGRHQESEAFVVCNDYRRGDFSITVFRTRDFGKTWENMLAKKNVKGYALCMLQDPVEPNLIFVGTEQGLWISYNNGKTFEQFKNGYPSVSTYDLALQEREADLVIATFGRALWVMDDIRPLRALAKNGGQRSSKRIEVYAPPVAYQAEYRTATGYEWSTWGLYEGENRKRGAMISFLIQQGSVKDSAKQHKADSVEVAISNEQQEVLRTIRMKPEAGLNRIHWNYDTKGKRYPGTPKPDPGAPEQGGGFPVPPGNYKVVVRYGGEADSTMLTIKADPRIPFSASLYESKKQLTERIQKSAGLLTAAIDRLTDAEETISKIESALKGNKTKEADSLRKACSEMTKEIKKLKEPIFGKKSDKQGIIRFPERTTLSTLQIARMEINQKLSKPTTLTERLVQDAEEAVTESVGSVEAFFKNSWSGFRKLAEQTPLNLFKE